MSEENKQKLKDHKINRIRSMSNRQLQQLI